VTEAVAAPASRNSPCPCGSGRRYKDCHGALGGIAAPAPPAAAVAQRSTYRAPAAEWAYLDDAARDDLGARMEHALALQTAGWADEAAREYGRVVALAPDTHDALHMLGVIELGRGNLDEAERLIAAALALRPPYPAIQHNLQLVHDARLALARSQPEQLAERALPILVDLALSPVVPVRPTGAGGARSTLPRSAAVQLIGRVHDGDHDDTWMLARLAAILGEHAAVWAVDGDGTEVVAGRRVQRVDAWIGLVPRGGTHVFVGVDVDCAAWIERAEADRVLVLCQSASPTRYLDKLRTIAHDGARPVELVFGTQAVADRFGAGHVVVPPPFDVQLLQRKAVEVAPVYDRWRIEPPPPWPVGIIGQGQHGVDEPYDAALVDTLGQIAGRLHVYDPGRFRYLLGSNPIARCSARRPGGLEPFLAGLACYVHRTPTWWQDSLGRELYGAMALGVPVLCPRISVHAGSIEHGVDGMLYDTPEEATQHLTDLRRAPALAAAIGRAGREKVLRRFDRSVLERRYRELAGLPVASASVAWTTGTA
jgi:glycosyltransferase involved in cell wall biosynthesis